MAEPVLVDSEMANIVLVHVEMEEKVLVIEEMVDTNISPCRNGINSII